MPARCFVSRRIRTCCCTDSRQRPTHDWMTRAFAHTGFRALSFLSLIFEGEAAKQSAERARQSVVREWAATTRTVRFTSPPHYTSREDALVASPPKTRERKD